MYKTQVQGKGCIVARIVQDSVSPEYDRITTFELEYPRFIHSELMTHRMLSRNAASSRAIPVNKMIEQVKNHPAMPIHWGANQKGMQASGECSNLVFLGLTYGANESYEVEDTWKEAANRAADIAQAMSDAGYHKQIVNRLLEPFQVMKTVVTATEWNNFFHLRDHKDAQPEIAELARVMREAMEQSVPDIINNDQWHVPYINRAYCPVSGPIYYLGDLDGSEIPLTEEQALKVSASCCAQVSYRLLDKSLDKALGIYDSLVNSKPVHASPFEHQAKPMVYSSNGECSSDGVTHADRANNYWSGNFNGWIQHRQLIKDNVVTG